MKTKLVCLGLLCLIILANFTSCHLRSQKKLSIIKESKKESILSKIKKIFCGGDKNDILQNENNEYYRNLHEICKQKLDEYQKEFKNKPINNKVKYKFEKLK